MKKSKLRKYLTIVFEYFMMAVGSAIAAFAIEEFLVPCRILDGGIVGVSMIINNFFGKVPLGVLTLGLNLPFLLAGMRKMGSRFVLKSAWASLSVSAAASTALRLSRCC